MYRILESVGNHVITYPIEYDTADTAAEALENLISLDILEGECRPDGMESLSELEPHKLEVHREHYASYYRIEGNESLTA